MGWSWRLSLVAALVLAGCGNSPAPADAGEPVDAGPADAGAPVDAGPADAGPGCTPGGDGGYRNQPFAKLSDYCLVSIEDGGVAFSPEVMPYDLNTPLFSDYAVKVRGAWLPPGTAATYSDARTPPRQAS